MGYASWGLIVFVTVFVGAACSKKEDKKEGAGSFPDVYGALKLTIPSF
jgi:hypothetical protein